MRRMIGFPACLVCISAFLAPPDVCADTSLLWGDLAAGPNDVGFRLIEDVDRSRAVTARAGSDRAAGRPIRIYIWYPARKRDRGAEMPFSRYAELTDADFWPRPAGREVLSDFGVGPLARSLSPERLAAVLAAKTAAVEDADVAEGRHPLIVFGQGLYYESPIAHAAVCEYLASHGYVVATCPLIGDDSRLVDLDVIDLETQVRDLEFVIAHARQLPFVSPERLGLLGFDMGGMSCVVLAMRNPDIDAFVSLDAGILYPHPSALPGSSPHYDPKRLRIPWLHVTQSGAIVTPEAQGSLFDTAVHAERYLALVDGVQHADFTSFSLIEGKEPAVGYWRRSSGHARRSYETVCRYLSRFFDAYLRGDNKAREFLADKRAATVPGVPLTIEHRAARPAPPTIGDFVNAVAENGVASAVEMARKLVTACPDCDLVQEATLNRLGYKYLYFWGHIDTAVDIFRLNVELHPESANPYDSLGEAYAFGGQTQLAIANYRKSLELDPTSENAKAALRRLEGD